MIDKVDEKRYPRYLAYDIIKFKGMEVGKTDFRTRLTCIEKEIVGARNTFITEVILPLHILYLVKVKKGFRKTCVM